jgi:competence protein ComEC
MTLDTLTALVNSLIHEPQAGLLNGFCGVKATLSEDLQNALITTGTLHIIALSGMNISIIVGFVNLFLLRFVRRPIANVATVFIIIGFIGFVGVSPSVIRAAIMASITLLGMNFGRQRWPLFIMDIRSHYHVSA